MTTTGTGEIVKLSTRTRYGLRAVVELATRHGHGTTSMQEIADNQELSRKYLDTLFNSLKVAGIASSRRGLGGGWELTRPPDQVHLGEVVEALEGSLGLVACVEQPQLCVRSETCVTRELYAEMNGAIRAVLERYTIDDLVQRRAVLEGLPEMAPIDVSCDALETGEPSDQ